MAFTRYRQTGPTITTRAYKKETNWGEVCGAIIVGFVVLCLIAGA